MLGAQHLLRLGLRHCSGIACGFACSLVGRACIRCRSRGSIGLRVRNSPLGLEGLVDLRVLLLVVADPGHVRALHLGVGLLELLDLLGKLLLDLAGEVTVGSGLAGAGRRLLLLAILALLALDLCHRNGACRRATALCDDRGLKRVAIRQQIGDGHGREVNAGHS